VGEKIPSADKKRSIGTREDYKKCRPARTLRSEKKTLGKENRSARETKTGSHRQKRKAEAAQKCTPPFTRKAVGRLVCRYQSGGFPEGRTEGAGGGKRDVPRKEQLIRRGQSPFPQAVGFGQFNSNAHKTWRKEERLGKVERDASYRKQSAATKASGECACVKPGKLHAPWAVFSSGRKGYSCMPGSRCPSEESKAPKQKQIA